MLLFLQKKKTSLVLAMAVFALLLALREPAPFFAGRFWAEECRVFYNQAWQVGFWHTVLWSYAGYLNLPANLGGALAYRLAPLAQAPRVTEALAIAGMACPLLVLLGSREAWLRRPGALPLATLALVAAPAVEEIWLNTLHIQFQLALAGALILSLQAETGRVRVLHRALLLLGPLSGMASVVLLPLLAARTALDRGHRRARLWQLAALGLGAAIQLGLFYQPTADRLHIAPVRILAAFYAKLIAEPFLGVVGEQDAMRLLWTELQTHTPPWQALLVTPPAVGAMLWLVARGPASALWLLLSAGLVASASFCGMLLPSDDVVLPHVSGRYAFVPQVCTMLALLATGFGAKGARTREIAAALAAWLLIMGVFAAFATPDGELHGPEWRAEIAAWRARPGYQPRCWPPDWRLFTLPEAMRGQGGARVAPPAGGG